MPVFLSKTLADNVHVLSYPLLNPQSSLNQARVINSCIKPVTQQLKIDFALDAASVNYDAFKGDQLAQAADGKLEGKQQQRQKGDKPTFKSGRMDKQSYVSSTSVHGVDRFMAALIRNGEIHLTPIKNMYQMRPSFSYFDKQDKRSKAENKQDDDEEEEARQVTVKFARSENERMKKAKEKSYNHFAQINEEEPWCETMWYPNSSEVAGLEKHKLLIGTLESQKHLISLERKEYLKNLLSTDEDGTSLEVPASSMIFSQRKLMQLPLVDQIQYLLISAKMLKFDTIVSYVTDKNIDRILHALGIVGTLIKGNWVVKSEVLYPEKMVSAINGVEAKFMVRAREYILYRFTQSEFLDRSQITTITKLPDEETKEVLKGVSRFCEGKGWQLILPPDENFERAYPDLVQRQNLYWNGKQEELIELEQAAESVKRQRKKSHRESK